MWDLRSPTRDQTCIPCTGRWILNHWTAGDVPEILTLITPSQTLFPNRVPFTGAQGWEPDVWGTPCNPLQVAIGGWTWAFPSPSLCSVLPSLEQIKMDHFAPCSLG